jgi:hypothetical protein
MYIRPCACTLVTSISRWKNNKRRVRAEKFVDAKQLVHTATRKLRKTSYERTQMDVPGICMKALKSTGAGQYGQCAWHVGI